MTYKIVYQLCIFILVSVSTICKDVFIGSLNELRRTRLDLADSRVLKPTRRTMKRASTKTRLKTKT